MSTYPEDKQWTYRTKNGYERTTGLGFYYELANDPISDDYTPDEIDAHELFHMWVNHHKKKETVNVPIYWFVEATDGGTEFAPYTDQFEETFLTHFSWPVDPETGDRVNFLRLPVLDKRWNTSDGGDKGGFVQEVTGWKPGVLQPWIPLQALIDAAAYA